MLKQYNKKGLKVFIVLSVVILMFVLFSQSAFAARTLENNYPEIPLPLPGGVGNISLNDIQAGIADKDPLSLLILYFYTMSVMVVGIVAFGVIIMAGFKILTSGANPGLRNEAKSQLQAAITGIVILLGSWLILNTINPELVLLHKPGESPGTVSGISTFDDIGSIRPEDPFAVNIDLETLRYGGVVIYRDEDTTDGSSGKSEVVLNNIRNFDGSTWVTNDKVRGIKIIGDCDIRLFEHADFNDNDQTSGGVWSIDGPIEGTAAQLGFDSEKVSSLTFDKRACLGNSITVYEKKNSEGDRKEIIYNDANLSGDFLLPNLRLNDEISSIRFVQETPLGLFTIRVCEDKNLGKQCEETDKSEPDFGVADSEIPAELNDKISSIYLEGDGKYRQAGVILYGHADFKGISEVFISSDKKLNSDNIIQAKGESFDGSNLVSSLRIIGKYKVTIYKNNLFGGQWIEIDNTNGIPIFRWSVDSSMPPNITLGEPTREFYNSNIVEIPNLSVFGLVGGSNDNWNDEVKSIKIELPTP